MQEDRESTHINIISHSNELHEAFVEVHDKNGNTVLLHILEHITTLEALHYRAFVEGGAHTLQVVYLQCIRAPPLTEVQQYIHVRLLIQRKNGISSISTQCLLHVILKTKVDYQNYYYFKYYQYKIAVKVVLLQTLGGSFEAFNAQTSVGV